MMTAVAGRFWRSVFLTDVGRVLDGARSVEGRYHHDGQAALYMSPSPGFSRIAIDAYLRPDDPPRVIVPLEVRQANLADLRDPAVQQQLGLNGAESGTLWQPERAAGKAATSWIASDAARNAGADGIIYAARSDAARWHIVLFRWNVPDGPLVAQDGSPIPF
ncbi:MAG: RES family NAD+ phosphorylase [Paracoccaceae bacterium]